MQVFLAWAQFKLAVVNKGRLRFVERSDFYSLQYNDLETSIVKDGGIDQADFEIGFKSFANDPTVTPNVISTGKIDPVLGREIFSVSAFAVNSDYEVRATGFKGVAAFGVTTNLHMAIGAEDRYINGLELLAETAVMGDTSGMFVTDQDNLLGYGAGTVLKQFGDFWNVSPGRVGQGLVTFNYAARIPAGMYIRIAYTSVGAVDVKVGCNFLLHKKIL